MFIWEYSTCLDPESPQNTSYQTPNPKIDWHCCLYQVQYQTTVLCAWVMFYSQRYLSCVILDISTDIGKRYKRKPLIRCGVLVSYIARQIHILYLINATILWQILYLGKVCLTSFTLHIDTTLPLHCMMCRGRDWGVVVCGRWRDIKILQDSYLWPSIYLRLKLYKARHNNILLPKLSPVPLLECDYFT